MIIDYRAYSFRPGTVRDFVEMFRAEGLPIQNRILGKEVFAGLFTTEFGDVNEAIHLWRYRNSEERTRKRALLYDDTEFMDYVMKARQIIVKQDVRLLNEVDFGGL